MEHNQIYQLQRPNVSILQLKYLNLKITPNLIFATPRLDQNAYYDATAYNSWQINNSLQFSIPILILCSSEIEIYNRHPTCMSKMALLALAI